MCKQFFIQNLVLINRSIPPLRSPQPPLTRQEAAVDDVDFSTHEITRHSSALNETAHPRNRRVSLPRRREGKNNIPRSTGQVHNRTRQILRYAPPPRRHSPENSRLPLLAGPDALRQLRGDIARRQGRHADALSHPLVTQGFRELANGAFGGGVGADVQAAGVREDRRDVDDLLLVGARGRGGGEPVLGEGAREDEGGGEVDLDDLWSFHTG